jgi:hypothetical protein
MIQYIQNLLPRLQQFSQRLDHIENFVDKPWVLIDEEGNRHIYIFQRNQSLIMSLNGKVQVGKWEYIQAAKSLLIDRQIDKILLNNAFVEKGLMILRMDGSPDRPWVLANETEIPDLDVPRYLKELMIRKLHLRILHTNGKTYYFADPNNQGVKPETVFFDEYFKQTADSFSLTNDEKVFNVQNGIVRESYYVNGLNTDKGYITIQSAETIPDIYDRVFCNGHRAPDGVYKVVKDDLFKRIIVKDGEIINIKENINFLPAICILAIFLLILLVALFNNMNNG